MGILNWIATAILQWKNFTTNKIYMYIMFYVLPFYNMVNSTSLMEKINWEDIFPDDFATVYKIEKFS
jgi:hypothetical protein